MSNRSHRQSSVSSPALPPGMSAWEMIMPPAALPLLGLLLLVTPMVLLTAESLFVPLFEWLKARLLMAPGDAMSFGDLPPYFFVKLLAFVVLSFLGCFQLLLRIKTLYYTAWAQAFPRPHPLHVDYHSDTERGIVALIQWKLYQIAIIVMPPILMATLTFVVGMIELYLFNTFSELSFIGLSIQITIEMFLIMMLGMFTMGAFLNSVWVALTSLFGDVAAITEPDLPNPIIMQRCNRIVFATPYTYVLIPAYLLLVLGVTGEIFWLLNDVEIHHFVFNQANLPNLPLAGTILLLETVTFAWYMAFNFFKFYAYHQGLAHYYSKLPAQLKECFTPPPATEPVSHTGTLPSY